jgi:hypothetical protein
MGSHLTEEEAELVGRAIAHTILDFWSWIKSIKNIDWKSIMSPDGDDPLKDDPFFYDELFETY